MVAPARAWLIDASIYIFRAWFSLPDRWRTADGRPLNAVYGYTGFLLDFIGRAAPLEFAAAAFDESLGSCFRNDILPAYKASRELPDEDLAFQLDACREVTELLGLPCYSGSRYEADDYLASLATVCRGAGLAVTIVTRDKDLGQILAAEDDHWWDFASDTVLHPAAFEQRFGVPPDKFADYLALVGDPVDDIPGVPGIGAKTAAALLAAFDNLNELGSALDRVSALPIRGATRVAERLAQHWPQVELARRLTGLEYAIPGVDLVPEFQPQAERFLALEARLADWGMPSSLRRRCEHLAGECAR